MIQQDYILRLIEQLSVLLRRLFRSEKGLDGVLEEHEVHAEEFAGSIDCDARLARTFGNESRARRAAQEALYRYEQLLCDPSVPAKYRIEEKREDVLRFLKSKG